MFLDKYSLFSEGQAITADTASDNIVDFGSDADMGEGNPVKLIIQVTEDFDNLTTMTVHVETDSAADFASAQIIASSEAAPASDLKAGFLFDITALPEGSKRYVRLSYDIDGVAPAQGRITAGFVADHQTNH